MSKKNISLNFIDVFSGAGGLSCGMEIAGHKCLLGIEIDKHAIETFKVNHKHANVYCGDITKLQSKNLYQLINDKEIHAVVGGPPCQGFSTVGLGNPQDKRNQLFREFVRIVNITNPYFVVIENVTGLLAKKNEKILDNIFKIFSKLGYQLDVKVLSAENYGVPEKRRRTIILGSRINHEIIFPKETYNCEIENKFIPAKTIGEVFSNLKSHDGNIYNHDIISSKIKSPIDLERIKCIPEGKGIRYVADEKNYLPKKIKLNIDWKTLPENRFRQTKYQRLNRNSQSPTIMTHRHNYFHPTENRYLTPREAAAIQSFPNDFIFMGPLSAQWKQIGNAVPPLLGKAIGQALSSMYHLGQKQNASKSLNKLKNKTKVKEVRQKAFLYKNI